MSRIALILFLIIFSQNSCSINKKNYNLFKSNEIKEPKKVVVKKLFRNEKILDKEFNKNLKIDLSNQFKNNTLKKNLDNNIGRVNYDSPLKKLTKFSIQGERF